MVSDNFLSFYDIPIFSRSLSQWELKLSVFNVALTDSLISHCDSADSCSFVTFSNRRN